MSGTAAPLVTTHALTEVARAIIGRLDEQIPADEAASDLESSGTRKSLIDSSEARGTGIVAHQRHGLDTQTRCKSGLFSSIGKSVPAQVGTNTSGGLVRLHATAFELIRAAGKESREVTVKDFTILLASGYRSALTGLTDIDRLAIQTL